MAFNALVLGVPWSLYPRWLQSVLYFPSHRWFHRTWAASETDVPQSTLSHLPDTPHQTMMPQFQQELAIQEITLLLYHQQKAAMSGLRPRTNLCVLTRNFHPAPTLNFSPHPAPGAGLPPFFPPAWFLYNPAILAAQISCYLGPGYLSWSVALLLLWLPLFPLMAQFGLLAKFSLDSSLPAFSLISTIKISSIL